MKKGHFNPLLLIIALLFVSGCSSLRQIVLKRELEQSTIKSPVLSKYFVGLSLYDPETQEYLLKINGDKYFTPASNTKILTLATWLATQQDSIPSFRYALDQDRLIIEPLGDPTLLHPDFPNQQTLSFLLHAFVDTVFIQWPAGKLNPFGTGWAWDDYNYAYQPERSHLPLYGNTLHAFSSKDKWKIVPEHFENYVEYGDFKSGRAKEYNLFQLSERSNSQQSREVQIPFKTSEELTIQLLQDTLGIPVVSTSTRVPSTDMQILYGYPRLPVLATMMLNSDNFLAEQLLINAQLFQGNENFSSFLSHTQRSVFAQSPHPLEWVDGSGLSRYNMFTPMSLVKVLEVIYKQLSWQEINLIFPKGGVSGTLKNWYAAETPYVFAKTGTLRHNHCLSGYLLTKSGKRLIFSFMNNHYTSNSAEVKVEIQRILEQIRDAY